MNIHKSQLNFDVPLGTVQLTHSQQDWTLDFVSQKYAPEVRDDGYYLWHPGIPFWDTSD